MKVLAVEPEREFRWLGRWLMPWLLDGDHRLLLCPLGEKRVRVIQTEEFRGFVVPFLGPWLVPNMRRGFEEMNRGLKDWAERLEATQSRQVS